jgi:hypothetical protein
MPRTGRPAARSVRTIASPRCPALPVTRIIGRARTLESYPISLLTTLAV